MTNDVFLSMKGMQFGINQETGEGEEVEIITTAKYFKRNESGYLLYDEILEGIDTPVSNRVKYNNGVIEVTKKGAINVHMVFEEGKQNMTSYYTPYGNLMIGINTRKVQIIETDELIHLQADYALDVNYEFLADCQVCMDIRPKDQIKL